MVICVTFYWYKQYFWYKNWFNFLRTFGSSRFNSPNSVGIVFLQQSKAFREILVFNNMSVSCHFSYWNCQFELFFMIKNKVTSIVYSKSQLFALHKFACIAHISHFHIGRLETFFFFRVSIFLWPNFRMLFAAFPSNINNRGQ